MKIKKIIDILNIPMIFTIHGLEIFYRFRDS